MDGIKVIWEKNEYIFPLNYDLIEQDITERKWEKVLIEELFSISGLEESTILHPLQIKLYNSKVYLLNGASGNFRSYNYNGDYINEVGNGFGNGPGQFNHPFDFSIDTQGNFYVVDIGKRSLVSLDEKGKFRWQKQYKLNTPGLVSASDSIVIASTTGLKVNHILEAFDIDGNQIKTYQNIVNRNDEIDDNIKIFGKVLLGSFQYKHNKLIFIPRFLSQILFFNEEGSVDFAIKTIDETVYPKITFGKDPVHGLAGLFPIAFEGVDVNLDFHIVDDKIIIWSQQGNEKYGAHIFDVYSLHTGAYKHSFKLNLGAISKFVLTGSNIFTINSVSTKVKGYTLNYEDL